MKRSSKEKSKVIFYTCRECKENFIVKDDQVLGSPNKKMSITDKIRCPYCYSPSYYQKTLMSKR